MSSSSSSSARAIWLDHFSTLTEKISPALDTGRTIIIPQTERTKFTAMISPDIKLKDRITRRSEGMDDKKDHTGEVVYIHPQRRYFTLRFQFRFGSFCESYLS